MVAPVESFAVPGARVLVLGPRFAFPALAERLSHLGWRREADLTAPPELIAGEPDMAAWTHGGSGARLVYSFHPAISLRVLQIEGAEAERHAVELAGHFPVLALDDVAELLRSPTPESALLGLRAATALGAIALLDLIAALTGHSDELVGAEARRAFQKLLEQAAGTSIRILSAWKARHPERSLMFLLAGGPHERRQLLRWLIHDREASNAHIDAALRTALEDRDWEVRATAMLAAARLKAVAVRDAVRRVHLPDSTREGLDANDRRILAAFRKASLALLEGQPPPPLSDAALTTREAMQTHILRCVAGLPVHEHDRVFLLAHSLTHPLVLPEFEGSPLPCAIDHEAGRFFLKGTDVELIWVAPVSHWLGGELDRAPISNPIRDVTPATGFFITQRPLARSTLAPFDLVLRDDCSPAQTHGYILCDCAAAERICASLTERLGLEISLPTADEWEMAARGPDGRRFPWGNGLENDWHVQPSPWGASDMVGILPQWTATRTDQGSQIVCAGRRPLPCFWRAPAPESASAAGLCFVARISASEMRSRPEES